MTLYFYKYANNKLKIEWEIIYLTELNSWRGEYNFFFERFFSLEFLVVELSE